MSTTSMSISSALKDRINPIDFKLALKTSLAALLSLFVCLEMDQYIQRPDTLVSGLWCVVASIFASQPTLGGTYTAIWNRFLGVFMGSLIGAFFAYFLGAEAFFLGLAIFSTIILCNFLGLKESYRMASLSVVVVMIPWGLNPSLSPWTYASFRFLDTCVGLGVAMFVAQGLWPSQALAKMRLNMVEILNLLRLFYEEALLPAESLHRSERILQGLTSEINQALSKNQAMFEESKVELFILLSPINIWVDLVSGLNRLWRGMQELENVFSAKVEEVFDESLKERIHYASETINFTLKALADKLKTGESAFSFSVIYSLQHSLSQEFVRFRLTKATKKYSLEVVENYFVFSYTFKLILQELYDLNALIDQLESSSQTETEMHI